MADAAIEEAPAQPTRTKERLVALDFIRGISVLGILFANIVAFGHPLLAYTWPGALPYGGTATDGWIWLLQFVVVDGKFRGLFSVLFGAGLYIFHDRLLTQGGSIHLLLRRLLWLGLFGLAHFFLLFVGDILFLYALAGFGALLMLHWSARTQLVAGIVWYLAGSLAFSAMLTPSALIEASVAAGSGHPEARIQAETVWQNRLAKAEAETQVVREGSYGEIVRFRLDHQTDQLSFAVYLAMFETIPLMLLGMALLRLGMFDVRLDRTRMHRWGWAGLAVGGLVSLALGWWVLALKFPPQFTYLVFHGLAAFPRLPMILGLAVLLSLWADKASQGWLGERLVAAGRMAFSNYILTSAVMMVVFHGWAGGHYGRMSRSELLLAVLLGWTMMIAWSRPWLARFRFGPLEWIWRCLTYGRLFPLRR